MISNNAAWLISLYIGSSVILSIILGRFFRLASPAQSSLLELKTESDLTTLKQLSEPVLVMKQELTNRPHSKRRGARVRR